MADQPSHEDDYRWLFDDIRAAEPSDSQVLGALCRSHPIRKTRRSIALATTAILVVIVGISLLAIPVARSAIDDRWGELVAFFSGGQSPGSPINDVDQPGSLNWFRNDARGTVTVLAQDGNERLIAYRDATTGQACVAYGLAVNECKTTSEWLPLLKQSVVLIRGPAGASETGKVVWYGLTASTVAYIRLMFPDGSSTATVPARLGFALRVEAGRMPTSVVAFDSLDQPLATLPVSEREWPPSGS
jgi:hypothetical protein